MTKIEELEKSLKEYRELLKNAMMGYPDIGGQAGAGAQAGAAASDQGVNKMEHETCGTMDSKKDQKAISDALDEHNEKEHGEAKDKDSAKKSEINMEVIKFDNNNQWSI